MNAVKISTKPLVRPRRLPSRLKAPYPLPLRPLPVDRFIAPRGQKQVYLPSFTITFLHVTKQDPHFASFMVPLWFSKLDLKDYLYNLYGVKALRIRSYVIQSKVREGKPRDIRQKPHNFYRPQSKKKMTIEMIPNEVGQGPFVWPEEPKDWRPWAKKEFDDARQQQTKMTERMQNKGKVWPEDMGSLRQQAAEMVREARERERARVAAGVGSGG